MCTPDRPLNPDSFYEKETESEEETALCCDSCGDIIYEYQEHFHNGFPYCPYCVRYILNSKC